VVPAPQDEFQIRLQAPRDGRIGEGRGRREEEEEDEEEEGDVALVPFFRNLFRAT
jgi:hypothetical protein